MTVKATVGLQVTKKVGIGKTTLLSLFSAKCVKKMNKENEGGKCTKIKCWEILLDHPFTMNHVTYNRLVYVV